MSILIAMKRRGRVVLAADSLYRCTRADGTEDTLRQQKIRECYSPDSGYWYVTCGGYRTHAGSTWPDAYDLVALALRTTRDVTKAIQAIHEATKRPLNEGLGVLAAHGVVPMFCAVVARLDDAGQPLMGIYHRHGVQVSGHTYGPADAYDFVASVEVPGGAIDLTRRAAGEAWLRRGDLAAVRRLLAAQARATPDRIGPPYDVLTLTADGAEWQYRIDINERTPA